MKSLVRLLARSSFAQPIRTVYRRHWVLPRQHERYSSMTIEETFRRVYATREWGGESMEAFHSGSGSDTGFAAKYCEYVNEFIRGAAINRVADLGCGDFRVGRMIANSGVVYVGADVVPELVDYNTRHFGASSVSFQCLDITRDALPDADLCLVRQVFQHLSNAEIGAALHQCKKFKYVIVSEHVPKNRPARPNLDKPHGPDIRAFQNSGVFLDDPPFSEEVRDLFEVSVDSRSVIRTVLIQNP